MRNIRRPTFEVQAILQSCADSIRDRELAARLHAAIGHFAELEALYAQRAVGGELYRFPIEAVTGGILSDEMSWLYTKVFSRIKGPTRHIYDAIRLAPPGLICPLCNQRIVSTLDHHMSKQDYPGFALTPFNLVPSCKDCNTDTNVRSMTEPGNQTVHPYFDNVDDSIWLYGVVEESTPPVIRFEVRAPDNWEAGKRQKVEYHFRTFKLAQLYTVHAGSELQNIAGDVERISQNLGFEGVREELAYRAAGRRRHLRNTWQGAMYSALAESDWFCSEGHLVI